jgi:hypothetical protein
MQQCQRPLNLLFVKLALLYTYVTHSFQSVFLPTNALKYSAHCTAFVNKYRPIVLHVDVVERCL